MSGSYWFNAERVRQAVTAGMRDGLDESGDRVAGEAKRRAPIRKVFKERKGFRRKFRALTDAERNLAIARANRYYGVSGNELVGRTSPRESLRGYTATVQLPRRGSANALVASRKLRIVGYEKQGRFTGVGGTTRNREGGFEPGEELAKRLTSRGRYEMRTGRSIHYEPSAAGTQVRVQVGGKLKASIGNEGVTESGKGQRVTVSAAIRYAKFVEFPTIRTSAQPFLLPALHNERGKVVGTIADAIRRNLGG